MLNIKLLIFNLRELLIKNFKTKLIAIKKNNFILYPNFLLKLIFYFLRLIPFTFLLYITKKTNYQLIYLRDNIIQISGINNNHILPIILKFNIGKNNNYNSLINFKTNIKYFNNSLPLKFILLYNKLYNYDFIEIEYLFKGVRNNRIIYLNNNNLNLCLYELFI